MKNLIVLFVALLMLAASCAPHKTCPTYLKNTNEQGAVKKV
ncbi:MAG: hypothetical protein NW207_11235 [Cytophagales bacterium]|nr:hypothetical protein [Cytophagales bacterium]